MVVLKRDENEKDVEVKNVETVELKENENHMDEEMGLENDENKAVIVLKGNQK